MEFLSYIFYVAVNQEMIDYMSEEMNIKFEVLDNLVDDANSFLQRVIIGNNGNVDILPGDWSIFFYHIRAINKLKSLPLPDCGMVIDHVAGSLYKLSPSKASFKTLKASEKIHCDFHAKYWSVAVTDNMPNWYVWSEGTDPKILRSTEGEQLNFVGQYDTANKWKRYQADTYDPFLPRTRYVLNGNVKDLGIGNKVVKEGTYIIPTPVDIEVDTDEFLHVKAEDGWVMEENTRFSNEVKMIAGNKHKQTMKKCTSFLGLVSLKFNHCCKYNKYSKLHFPFFTLFFKLHVDL